MPKVKASEFISYIESKVGSAYLWGGQGERLYDIVAKYATTKNQSESKTVKMLGFLENNGIQDIQFFDCSGLGVSYLLEQGAISCDMTADGIYKKCKKIVKNEARPSDMVFLINSSGKATHIGYLVEENVVVHALNQSVGVIREPLGKRKWKFGRPEFCMEYDLEQKIDISTLKPGDMISINKEVNGYNTAANAIAAVNPTVTYPAGTYYVYKVYGQAVNITKKKGVAGAWVIL